MKKIILIFLIGIFTSMSYANIPYCAGTTVKGSKHKALQYVIETFAKENNCLIGENCIRRFDKIRYAIAWAEACDGSARRGNDPKGSTFVCSKGFCHPDGFYEPNATY